MTDWWTGIAPAQASVECGGAEHRIRWAAGAVTALDHDDPEGERALAALGGQRCTCVDLLDAWERHAEDPRVLVLASRGPRDQLAQQLDPTQGRMIPGRRGPIMPRQALSARATSVRSAGIMVAGAGGGPFQPLGRSSAAARTEAELQALLGLGGGLADRLSATVAAAWRERLEQRRRPVAGVRRQLHAALYGRVLAATRTWLGDLGAPALELTMVAERGRRSLRWSDGVVQAALPFGWLLDVWARDLATIGGRFTLSASSDDGRTWTLTTVAPDFGGPSRIVLTLS